jgi:hypothetical protein
VTVADDPGQEPGPSAAEPDPLARFRSWRGFLVAAILLNALFVWGLWGSASDPSVGAWTKALSWFPFNVIASVLYLVFMAKLSQTDGAAAQAAGTADKAATGAVFYIILCAVMIVANWALMLAA